MEDAEMKEVLDFIDLKLSPLNVEIKYMADRFDRFVNTVKWVMAVILVPLLFFILDKVF